MSEGTELKKKYIIFRNLSKQTIAKVEIPKYIKLTSSQVCNLQELPNRLKMLYIDVLCRGFHPVKGFESSARNVFKHEQFQDDDESLTKNVSLIPIVSIDAVSTIWRCLAREIGRPIKNYNMKQVQQQIMFNVKKLRQNSTVSKYNLHNVNTQELQQYKNTQEQLDELEQQIKNQMQIITMRCKSQQNNRKQTQSIIAEVISHQILQLQYKIFVKSLVGIRQCGQNTQIVQFVLQQCYPCIMIKKKQAINILGQQLFNQKFRKYTQILQRYKINSQEDDIIVCHRCLTVLNAYSRLMTCDDTRAIPKIGNSLYCDPYIYCKQIINQNRIQKQTQQFIHPYLLYYFQNDSKKNPVCNRYFCNKCQGEEPSLQEPVRTCGYCSGQCICYRCQNMDILTKMMAIFIDNGGDLKILSSKFLMNFPTKILSVTNRKKKYQQKIQMDFKEHLKLFNQQHIILKKDQIQKYQKTQYFSQRIEEDVRIKFAKLKKKQLILPPSELDRVEKKQKQKQENQRVKKLTDIIDGRVYNKTKIQHNDQEQKQEQNYIEPRSNRQQQKMDLSTKKASKNQTQIEKSSNSNQRFEIFQQQDEDS